MGGYRFGEFHLDSETRQLLRRDAPQHLSPKAFHLLQLLLESAPRALAKSELQDALWPGTFVVEANLQHLVAEIRAALGDRPRTPQFVRTVHGFGYAFQQVPDRSDPPRRATVACLLRWDGGRARLAEGEHVIGRDPAADVVLDFVTVSRQHARVRVGPAGVMLEDLGSKNGTSVGSRRVDGSVELADGDALIVGKVPVSVRITARIPSTETAILSAHAGKRTHQRS